jgi:hypothetical protein
MKIYISLLKVNIMKFIVWGHKLHSHTHSYIHYGYYKAFNSLGYECYWYDNNDRIEAVIDSKTIFLKEVQVDQNIPLIKDAYYILHHCNLDKYIKAGCNIINLCNYVKYCDEGISFNYKDSYNIVDKISDLCYYDKKANAIYQPWATDLLPSEINIDNIICHDDNKSNINFIG